MQEVFVFALDRKYKMEVINSISLYDLTLCGYLVVGACEEGRAQISDIVTRQ